MERFNTNNDCPLWTLRLWMDVAEISGSLNWQASSQEEQHMFMALLNPEPEQSNPRPPELPGIGPTNVSRSPPSCSNIPLFQDSMSAVLRILIFSEGKALTFSFHTHPRRPSESPLLASICSQCFSLWQQGGVRAGFGGQPWFESQSCSLQLHSLGQSSSSQSLFSHPHIRGANLSKRNARG